MDFVPSAAQAEAVSEVTRWYNDPYAPQVYRLFGYAGSGKSSLAQHIAHELVPDGPVLYAAYSGKAANVLARKGCAGASTIHSLIYLPAPKSREQIRALEAELNEARSALPLDKLRVHELEIDLETAQQRFHKPSWTLREDSMLRQAKLLVLDEVSMVNEYMAADLQSFGVRILCLGDPAQLPPVKGEGYYTGVRPDTMLTEIHRSALNSPVTRIATAVRQSQGRRWAPRDMDGDSGYSTAAVPLGDFDQVLVGTNATRWAVIRKMRKLAGVRGEDQHRPVTGERIIVLSNNRDLGVMNGQQFEVLQRYETIDHVGHRLAVRDEDGHDRELVVHPGGFEGKDGEEQAKRQGWRGPIAAATFAHAITVHKAQGSQWDNVLVLDESGVFGRRDPEMGRRWFYTAVTRAAGRVVIRPAP